MQTLTSINPRAFSQVQPAKKEPAVRFGMNQPLAEAHEQGERRGHINLSRVIHRVREHLLASFNISTLFARTPAQVAPELIQALQDEDPASRARRAIAILRAAPRSHRAAILSFADNDGNTPLHLAVINLEAEEIGNLLKLVPRTKRAASVTKPNGQGHTAFHMAVREGSLGKVQALLNALPQNQRAAIVNHRDGQGRTSMQQLLELAAQQAARTPLWMDYMQLIDYLFGVQFGIQIG